MPHVSLRRQWLSQLEDLFLIDAILQLTSDDEFEQDFDLEDNLNMHDDNFISQLFDDEMAQPSAKPDFRYSEPEDTLVS
jgi:hypothetical protein